MHYSHTYYYSSLQIRIYCNDCILVSYPSCSIALSLFELYGQWASSNMLIYYYYIILLHFINIIINAITYIQINIVSLKHQASNIWHWLQLYYFSNKCFTIVDEAAAHYHLCRIILICLFCLGVCDSSYEKYYHHWSLLSISLIAPAKYYRVICLLQFLPDQVRQNLLE